MAKAKSERMMYPVYVKYPGKRTRRDPETDEPLEIDVIEKRSFLIRASSVQFAKDRAMQELTDVTAAGIEIAFCVYGPLPFIELEPPVTIEINGQSFTYNQGGSAGIKHLLEGK